MSEDPHDEEIEISVRRKRALAKKRLADAGISSQQEYPPGTPVVIYKRVSSEEQIDGFSLSAQEHACREFAGSEKRQWQVTEVFEDPGHSGKNDKRPGFQAMMQAARSGRYKVILIHKLDRFSRNIDNTLKNFRELNELDVTIVSVTEDFDYSTTQGRMFFRMMAVFAQWYIENLSAEAIKGKKERARKGLHNNRLPFGYTLVEGNKVAQVVPAEAEVIRKAFQLYATSAYTDRQIAQMLGESGYKTRTGRLWSKDTVRDFLQNEFFFGKVAYRDELHPGQHEPIINRELFDRCQETRRKHAGRKRSYQNQPKRYYFLQRLIHCSKCHRPLRMQTSLKYRYYKDASRERGLECEHAGLSIRMDRADDAVMAFLKQFRMPEHWQERIKDGAEERSQRQQIEKRRKSLLDKKARLGRALVDAAIPEDAYNAEMEAVNAALGALVMPGDGSTLIEKGLHLDTMHDLLEEAGEADLFKLSHHLLEAVYFDLEKDKLISFRPGRDFLYLFRITAEEVGWREDQPGVFRVG
jgi:site-specific DNA recombinase